MRRRPAYSSFWAGSQGSATNRRYHGILGQSDLMTTPGEDVEREEIPDLPRLSRKQRSRVAYRNGKVRASKIAEHRHVYGNHLAFGVEQRTARSAVGGLRIVDDLVGQ